MADHRAQQILDAIVTTVTGLTTTGTNVDLDQVDPVGTSRLPHLSVDMGTDDKLEGSDANMSYMDSVLSVGIVARVKNSTGLSAELNQIRKEVHIAMAADYQLGLPAFVIDTVYIGSSVVDKSGELEKEAALQSFNYQVLYRHSLTDPSA